MAGKSDAPAAAAPTKPRSVAEIEADIEASRERLVETVGQLQVAVKETVNPRRVVAIQITRIKGFYVDEYGGVRPERVVLTVTVVVGVLALRKLKRRIFNKS